MSEYLMSTDSNVMSLCHEKCNLAQTLIKICKNPAN